MVRYSKLAFRQLAHHYGTDLAWTPMILAKEFNRSSIARDSDFDLPTDPYAVPTILQFGANSPVEFARASVTVAPYVSGVDLNCGCPQSWACAESLGAALMNKRELVCDIVKEAKTALARSGYEGRRTVSVKIRVHKDLRETVDFVKSVQEAGADFITIHGRTRSTRSSTPVDLDAIKLVAEHCQVPTLANGDIRTLANAKQITEYCGVNGVMSARDILSNPALYAGHNTCPWEAIERFMGYVIRAPIPFKLVVHHLGEMAGSVGFEDDGRVMEAPRAKALLDKEERRRLVECRNLLEVIDFLEEVRGLRRF
jgi:tRNA-dihydrouridine synthase 4